MNDEERNRLLEEVQSVITEQCESLRNSVDDLIRGMVGMTYAALMHLDKDDYESARQQLLDIIVILEKRKLEMEE
ncbi:MAG: hypothetical protein GOVbin1782_48 [Prokaryotic dsDNA virus sp.]|nr:MAG: hypothetical protein GOVbin1782_48 [Prokaryotic dsDNA virus sp.]|tara:strand:+ start:1145 stop:1369 length:225 start_codon:yes stop_codon:yes gene_type:complete